MKKRLISLTEDLDKQIQELAKSLGLTVNAVILQSLWQLVKEK